MLYILLIFLVIYSVATTLYILYLKTCSCRFIYNSVMCAIGFCYGICSNIFKHSCKYNTDEKKSQKVPFIEQQ